MDGMPGPGLSADTYYSPTPAALANELGRVVEVNAALETLLGRGSDAFFDRPAVELVQALSQPGEPGRDTTVGTNGDDVWWRESVYPSPVFGPVRLRGTVVPQHDPAGARTGAFFYWEVEENGAGPAFRAAFLQRLRHWLTWELYAISYDRILSLMRYYRLVLHRHRRALDRAGIRRVADLGAGTGNLVELLLRDGHEVVAVDPNRAMLARLWAKPWARDARLTVLRRSAEDLGLLEDESLDGVSILLALFDMERPEEALQEAIRILRRGGTIVVTEPKEQFDINVILHRCELRLRRLGALDSLRNDMDRVNTANLRLDPSSRPSRSLLRAEGVARLLRETGFSNLTFRDSHFRQCATVVATRSCS